jgi:methyl-accepting chemotaxis protein
MTIKKRITIALIAVFIGSTVTMGFFSYRHQMDQLLESLGDLPKNQSALFESIVASEAEGLARAQIGLTRLERLTRPFIEGKRDLLLGEATPLFEQMRKDNGITHMYFIEPDGKVFLRVHKPAQSGDVLTRTTYKQSAESGKIASGIEMGKNFFSLRCVKPLVVNGKLAGYMEVAQEIDDVFRRMKATTGNDVAVLLSQQYVDENKADVTKEKAGAFAYLDGTDEKMSVHIAKALAPVLGEGLKSPVVRLQKVDGATYAIGLAPLRDASGKTAGILLSQKNVTSLLQGVWVGLAINTIAFVAILAGAILFLFLSLRKSLQLFSRLKEHIVEVMQTWDLTREIEVDRSDEIGEVAEHFNTMIRQLSQLVGRVLESSSRLASVAETLGSNSASMREAAAANSTAAEFSSKTIAEMTSSINSVSGTAANLSSTTNTISASISQLGTSSEEVAKSSEVMASSVSETSATIEQMTASIDRVAQNSEELASSVTETSSTIEQMTVSIDQVAGNSQELQKIVEDTASTVEEMAVSIQQVAKNAAEADTVAKTASQEGAAGQQAVKEALAAMLRVAEVIEKTAASIENLGRRSEEIGTIVQVINEIADQTNLLALNAAIEAARAGDAGRGFAVVAEEVRKLAERSVNATREIGDVIKQVQADTSASVKYGELASREAKNSMDLSGVAGNALENIVRSIEMTSGLMTQINNMTTEQANASSQVIVAVQRMSQATAMVASAAREQAQGGRQIRIAVERMNSITQEVTGATREQAQGSRQIRIAVENMNHVSQQVTIATKEQALTSRQIIDAVNSMNGMTQSVAVATAEQKKGGEMVVKAMENISDATRENLSSVEQLAKSAETLNRQAADLSDLVAQFSVA